MTKEGFVCVYIKKVVNMYTYKGCIIKLIRLPLYFGHLNVILVSVISYQYVFDNYNI